MTLPTDPASRPLTLIMPIREGVDLLMLLGAVDSQYPAIAAALDGIGTVHFARFVVLDVSSPNLQPSPGSAGPFKLAVITTYDFDFDLYIRDFVFELADVFDALLAFTVDGATVTPVKENLTAFTDWVKKNDASQQWPYPQPVQYSGYPYDVQTIKAKGGRARTERS